MVTDNGTRESHLSHTGGDPKAPFTAAAYDAQTMTTGNNAQATGPAEPDSQDDTPEARQIKKRIRELKDLAQRAREEAKELELEQEKYAEGQTINTLSNGTHHYGLLPGGNIKVKNGQIGTGEDLSKPPKSQRDKIRQNKKLAEMVKVAAQGNYKHAVIETRNPLLPERKIKDHISEKKSLMPEWKKSVLFGWKWRSENAQLAQRANQIAQQLKLDITFHDSKESCENALKQEKEKLRQEHAKNHGKDAEELKKQREQAEGTIEELKASLPNKGGVADDRRHADSDTQPQQAANGSMRNMRAGRAPTSRPAGPANST